MPIEQCFVIVQTEPPLRLLEKLSSYTRLRRVRAWIFRFIMNCHQRGNEKKLDALSIDELKGANDFWISQTQLTSFREEIDTIKRRKPFPRAVDCYLSTLLWVLNVCFELVEGSAKQICITRSDTQMYCLQTITLWDWWSHMSISAFCTLVLRCSQPRSQEHTASWGGVAWHVT